MPLADLLADPRFRELPLADQTKLRAEAFLEISSDPRFSQLAPAEQLQLRREAMGAEEPPSLLSRAGQVAGDVAEKFGLGPLVGRTGPLESLTGPPTTEGSLLRGGVLPSVARGLDKGLAATLLLPVAGVPVAGTVAMGLGTAAKDIVELGGAVVGRVPGVGKLLNLVGLASPEAASVEETPFSQLVGLVGTVGGGAGLTKLPKPQPTREVLPKGTVILEPPEPPKPRPSKVSELLDPEPYTQAKIPHGAGLGSEVPSPFSPISQRESNERILDAAVELATKGHRPLDLGTVGEARRIKHLELEAAEKGRRVVVQAEEAPKVRLGLGAPPSERLTMPDGLAQTLDAVAPGPLGSPSSTALKIAVWKHRLGGIAPRLWGWPIDDIVKDVPEVLKAVMASYRGMDDAAAIERTINDFWATSARGLSRDSIIRVNKALDGALPTDQLASTTVSSRRTLGETLTGKPKLVNSESAAFAARREMLDKLRDPVAFRADYFPHPHQFLHATTVARIGDTPIKKVIEIVEGEKYIPVRAEQMISKEFRPFYKKARTLEGPAVDYSDEPLQLYAHNYARNAVLNGGLEPVTGRKFEGLLGVLRRGLADTPEQLLEPVTTWANDLLGVPRGKGLQLFGAATEPAVRTIKSVQTARLLGANLTSVLQNGLTDLNVFANTRNSSYAGSFKDMLNPVLWSEATKYNVVSNLSRADYEILGRARAEVLAGKVSQEVMSLFRASETLVRGKAYFAFLREAAANGLKGEEAVNWARDWVYKTQVRYSSEALPEGMRLPGAGQLVQQYKPFQIGQTLIYKNAISADVKDLAQGLTQHIPFKRTLKLLGGTIALVGSDAATMGLDKTISKVLTDNEDTLRVKGFFPAMGIYFFNQIGLGIIPIENFRSTLFFLPGPAISMVLDAMSIASSWVPTLDAPYGRDFSLDSLARQGLGSPLSPDQLATKMTRLLPVAGVFGDRIRKSLLQLANQGNVVESRNLRQAFGLEPQGGALLREGNSISAVKTAIGIQDPAVRKMQELVQENREILETRRRVIQQAARLFEAGDTEEAHQLLEAFEKKYGIRAVLSRESVRNARREQLAPVAERQIREAPRSARQLFRERLEKLREAD